MAGASVTRRRRRSGKLLTVPTKPATSPKVIRLRSLVVWAILMVGSVALTLNLFRLQILQGADLSARARQQQMTQVQTFAPRRQVVDRTGAVLALDRPVYRLFAHPKLFKQPKLEIAQKLSPILNRPASVLIKELDQSESGISLDYALAEEVASRVTRLQLDGLELVEHQERLYPYQELTADVVGYVNAEHVGQTGVERSQQDLLRRHSQAVQLRQMGNGSFAPDRAPDGFLNVDDLHLQLTIDTRLHRAILPVLDQQVKAHNAKRGTVIVLDATDGAVLALISTPTYNPNEFYKVPLERLKPWALTDLYEPGSTFKPINVAIALEAKVIKPDTVLPDEGRIVVDGWPIQNSDGGGRGPSTIGEIITHSSNVGMVHIIEQMKPEFYYTWLKRIGLGEATGIDLPSETAGQFKDRKVFTEAAIERATAAFGQGFSLTPLQLAQLHATLANGGKLVTPHVVKGLFDSNGQLYWQPQRTAPRKLFSAATTKAVLPMMESAVVEGTGKAAQLAGYRIAGKTGTSQKAAAGGGYSDDARVTSFVGIFPAEAPRYVVVAVVDEPAGGYGGTVAAPIVKTVIETVATLEKVAPSNPQSLGTSSAVDP